MLALCFECRGMSGIIKWCSCCFLCGGSITRLSVLFSALHRNFICRFDQPRDSAATLRFFISRHLSSYLRCGRGMGTSCRWYMHMTWCVALFYRCQSPTISFFTNAFSSIRRIRIILLGKSVCRISAGRYFRYILGCSYMTLTWCHRANNLTTRWLTICSSCFVSLRESHHFCHIIDLTPFI